MFLNPTIKLPVLYSYNPLWGQWSMVNGQIATTQYTPNYFLKFTIHSRNFLQVVAFLFQLLLEEVQRCLQCTMYFDTIFKFSNFYLLQKIRSHWQNVRKPYKLAEASSKKL